MNSALSLPYTVYSAHSQEAYSSIRSYYNVFVWCRVSSGWVPYYHYVSYAHHRLYTTYRRILMLTLQFLFNIWHAQINLIHIDFATCAYCIEFDIRLPDFSGRKGFHCIFYTFFTLVRLIMHTLYRYHDYGNILFNAIYKTRPRRKKFCWFDIWLGILCCLPASVGAQVQIYLVDWEPLGSRTRN